MITTISFFTEVELEGIQDRYVQVLRSYLEHAAPHHPGRLQELFARIPEVDTLYFFFGCKNSDQEINPSPVKLRHNIMHD